MGKLRFDPKDHLYPQKLSQTLKVMNRSPKKRVKITYISSPLFVRACHVSEFRSVVQQLTGKDSNNLLNFKNQSDPHKEGSSLRHNEDHSSTCRVMQGEDLRAIQDSNNRLMNSLEFDEDYFWKEVARSALHSPCVLV
ncbi:hypothetical protein VNO77_18519 [Canavalia gladiata]|uniref:VQ domain-containing protein n=1 Tax=Canavalia gladiata TaxID=3824 RepID=A0AAN9LPV8_CANGL